MALILSPNTAVIKQIAGMHLFAYFWIPAIDHGLFLTFWNVWSFTLFGKVQASFFFGRGGGLVGH